MTDKCCVTLCFAKRIFLLWGGKIFQKIRNSITYNLVIVVCSSLSRIQTIGSRFQLIKYWYCSVRLFGYIWNMLSSSIINVVLLIVWNEYLKNNCEKKTFLRNSLDYGLVQLILEYAIIKLFYKRYDWTRIIKQIC